MELAEAAAEQMHKETGDILHAYLCPYCHFYHIGRNHKQLNEEKK
jgi:hypothetical protein